MEILQVSHLYRPSIGGIENYSYRLANSLREADHSVSTITTDRSLENDRNPLGADPAVTYCKTTATLLRNPFSIDLYREVKRSTADIYHLHSPWYLSTLEAIHALPEGAPKVMTVHGFQPIHSILARVLDRLYRPFAQYVFDSVDRTIVLGEAEKRRLVHEFDVSPGDVVVIPNGIHPDDHDIPETAVERFRSRYDINPETPTVLFVSRLVELKRPRLLVNAVTTRLPDVDMDVVVVGDGTESFRWRVERRADDRFVFLSNLPFEDLQAAYHAADLFTMLSRSEGLPTVVLEAMNARLPIITTPVGALADIVIDGEHGWVLDSSPSEGELARAIRRYIEDPIEANATGDRNRTYVRSEFDWERVAREIESEYEDIIDTKRTESAGTRPPERCSTG
jgi:glycosyltransferase involved in cell wall biosynthesis